MIAGIAVQMISSRVLPWIGGPSMSSSPGRMRNCPDAVEDDVLTSTKIGTETIIRTSHSVSICLASSDAATGNQSISRPSAMPSADAMTPMTEQRRQ